MSHPTIVEKTFGSVEQLQSTFEPDELLDEERNLLLSKGELLDIQTYVRQGLSLPTNKEDFNKKLEIETDEDYSEFEELRNKMLLAYQGVHGNCQFWNDHVSKEIDELAKDIVDYAMRSVKTYNDLQALSDQLGDHPREDQDAIQRHFLRSINALIEQATERKESAAQLLKTLAAFRSKMGENQKNLSGIKDEASKEYNALEKETKELSQEINTFREQNKKDLKEYNKQVAIAATNSALVATYWWFVGIPCGIVAGIASDKAFKLDQGMKTAKKKIEANTKTMQRNLALMTLYNNARHAVDDFTKDLEGSVVPLVEKIEQIWQRMSSRLESITKILDQSKNNADALLRAVNFKEASDKWLLVKAKADHWRSIAKVEFVESNEK